MTIEEIKNTPELVDFMLDESVIANSREKLRKRLEKVCNLAIKALEQQPCDDCVSRNFMYELGATCIATRDKNYKLIALGTIENLPPVQPKPKTGHWIFDNNNWRCSECNETPKTIGYVGTADFMTEHFKFCNHCGAKMEPQESENKG